MLSDLRDIIHWSLNPGPVPNAGRSASRVRGCCDHTADSASHVPVMHSPMQISSSDVGEYVHVGRTVEMCLG